MNYHEPETLLIPDAATQQVANDTEVSDRSESGRWFPSTKVSNLLEMVLKVSRECVWLLGESQNVKQVRI